MITPRDGNPWHAVPVNVETGQPLTDRQQHHLQSIREAGELLYGAMHDAEGSTMPGDHQEHEFSSRRMKVAATYVEAALMFARKAALESP